jgi:16S rRNA pseudouridine516 synthase
MIRLDKFLSEMQLGTRSEVKAMIRSGRVTVDNKTCKSPELKIDPEQTTVALDHQTIGYARYEYFMLNKPKGCVSATEDGRYPTVLDYILEHKRGDLFPVGRLDLDTEGLLLITNDGALAHELLAPSRHVDKVYEALVDGQVTDEDVRIFRDGMDIGEKKPTKPAVLEIIKANVISQVRITISEGKFHQIKRMFEVVHKPVLELKRLSMGSLILDETLEPGQYRPLTEEEIQKLKEKRS